MMTNKKWIAYILLLSFSTLVLFAGIMLATDPLIQYGTENEVFTYYEYSEIYSNPGIAKSYNYDTVLVGTSMIQNTDVQECNEVFGCNMVRLSYSGGTCYNMKRILDVCFSSDNSIDTVYWELDEFQLFSDHDEPRYPLPEYLYNDTRWDDLSYLLNLDIFYHYTLNSALGTLKGQVQRVAREGETFTGDFSKEGAIGAYSRPDVSTEAVDTDRYLDKVQKNLQSNIIPLIEENPETNFVFFMVPFSILYWDNEMRNGTFDATISGLEYAVAELVDYDNVSIYFFHDEWDIVENLDNYKDYSHYGKWINSWMIQEISAGNSMLTSDNYVEILSEMKAYVYKYDFDRLFQ